MDTKKKKILSKIRKMLEMARRSEGNEEQAAVAAKMVENTMRKYNLTLADITPEEAKNDTLQARNQKYKWTAGKTPTWVNKLAVSLADTYDTFCVLTPANRNDGHVAKQQFNIAFVGLEVDVAVTLEMFDYLYSTVVKLTEQHFVKNPAPEGKGRTHKAAYRDGMATRLAIKLNELKQEKEVVETGTGLMVIKKDAIAAFLGRPAAYKASTRKTTRNEEAFNAGYQKGGSVSLNKQLK